MAVLDASVYAEALTHGGDLGRRARARVAADASWDAPHVLPAEVTSAMRGLLLAGAIAPHVAERARKRLGATRLRLHAFAPFAERVWELRSNLTVYDAWYVALAERLGVALVTSDERLASASGPRCDIEFVGARPL